MPDKKNIDKKDDKCEKLISIDSDEIEKITGGIRIGGIEYSKQTIGDELEDGIVKVKIRI